MNIFLSNYLLSSQGDRVAMAHSLELRHPFLDYRVIDFALRLPASWKLRALQEKYLLKSTFHRRLPKSVVQRPKQPYRAPIRELFLDCGGDSLLGQVLSQEALRDAGLFNPAKVDQLLRRLREGTPGSSEWQNMALVGIATSQLLHHQFIRGASLPAEPPAAADLIVRRPASGSRDAVGPEVFSPREVRKTG